MKKGIGILLAALVLVGLFVYSRKEPFVIRTYEKTDIKLVES